MATLTEREEETLLSVLWEADRHIRETPREHLDIPYLRKLLKEATAQLDTGKDRRQ